MSNPIQSLAKQTLIYGMSSILARMINFLALVPLYTRILSKYEFGKATEFYIIIALLQVVLTYGMETTYFKFATDKINQQKTFFSAYYLLFFTTSTFYLFTFIFAQNIADFLGYSDAKLLVIFAASILFLDIVTTLFFAKLRLENKAFRFAFIKSIKIISELFFNLFFFLILPLFFMNYPSTPFLGLISTTPDASYMLISGLLSCIVMIIFFIPQLLQLRLIVDWSLIKKILLYTFPLFIASLPGVLNDNLNRLLFRYFTPEGQTWQETLALFQAAVKLSVIMLLFIQMFRYAVEPYFFLQKQNKEAKKNYASIMNFFIAFGLLILIFTTANLDILQYYLGKDYREALFTVPIIMAANLFLGISFNISIWYKLSAKTWLAIPVTLSGLFVSFLIIFFFMPLYGYIAAAFSYLVSYMTICLVSYLLSLKYYKIDYDFKFIVKLFLFSVPLFFFIFWIREINILWIKYLLLELIPCLYIFLILKLNHEIRTYCLQTYKLLKAKLL